MTLYALTLVGPNLTQPKVTSLTDQLATRGLAVRESRWLAPAYALDMVLELEIMNPDQIGSLVLDVRRALPRIDVALQPIEGRRKALLVADMDSTLVPTETIDEMAAAHGVGEAVARLTDQAMQGRIDFAQALMERVAMVKGLPVAQVESLGQNQAFNPGAQILAATMAAHGARLVLVSGGFTHVTQHIAARLGLHRHVANQLAVMDGRLTGGLGLPLVDGAMKRQILEEECTNLGIRPAQATAIGDGANDSAMIQAAGLGVAYHGKPVLQKRADAAINNGDLTSLLYFQGYRHDEFITP